LTFKITLHGDCLEFEQKLLAGGVLLARTQGGRAVDDLTCVFVTRTIGISDVTVSIRS